MVTDVMLDYLDNESVSIEKKREFIKNCNLNMSDIFTLMDRYKYENNSVYRMLNAFVMYNDNRLHEQIKKQNKEYSQSLIYKKL